MSQPKVMCVSAVGVILAQSAPACHAARAGSSVCGLIASLVAQAASTPDSQAFFHISTNASGSSVCLDSIPNDHLRAVSFRSDIPMPES